MAYLKIRNYPVEYPQLPEMAVGSGGVDIEKIFAFAKRSITGSMMLLGYKGSVIKVQGKWSVLTRAQFNGLCSFLMKNNSFDVEVYDPRKFGDTKAVIQMYSGNIHGEPLFVDKATGLPRYYRNCTVNFISMEVE